MLEALVQEAPRFFTYYNGVFLLEALAATLLLSVSGVVAGSGIGAALALVRLGRRRLLWPVRVAALAYVESLRRIPFLVTLLLVFFGFRYLNLDVSSFWVSAVAVTVISSAYLAEIVRAGVQSVAQAQWDAAETMNMTWAQTLRYVILPQAWRVILPPTFVYFLGLIKDTSLASQLNVVELTYAGKALRTRGFSGALVYGTVLGLYFALSYPLARVGASLEVHVATARRRGRQ